MTWIEKIKAGFPQLRASRISLCILNVPGRPKWPEGLPTVPNLIEKLATLAAANVPELQQIEVVWGKSKAGMEISPDWDEIEVVEQYCTWSEKGG
ncbi:hypothetical protein AC578_8045 [Pseudocercospora eumusae]|uniref:Uncharacterized protein n=1 Tax=Pseudocercospora eumusae TaxID=321146 RepID=A0A139HGU0_9PEZI|nr:hypothetical protein AC578_8045 [Pseudocercospora eumusae]